MEIRGFKELAASGLRVGAGLDTRGKPVKIRFEAPAQINNGALSLYGGLSIGMYSYFRTGTVRNTASVGRYCSIGPNVMIGEAEHPTNWLSTSPAQYHLDQFAFYPPEAEAAAARRVARTAENNDGSSGKVEIGNDVWIGGGAIIRRGVRIGDGAIIAGGAFVGKDVAPYTIVGGVPARKIRMRFAPHIVDRLLALRWWDYDINHFGKVSFDNIEAAMDQIEGLVATGSIHKTLPRHSEVTLHPKGFSDLKIADGQLE